MSEKKGRGKYFDFKNLSLVEESKKKLRQRFVKRIRLQRQRWLQSFSGLWLCVHHPSQFVTARMRMPQNGFKIGRAVVVVPLAEAAYLKPVARGLNPTVIVLTYASGARKG